MRSLDSQGCKVSSCGQRRLCSDWEDAQADLSARFVHMSEGMFSHVMACLSVASFNTIRQNRIDICLRYARTYWSLYKIGVYLYQFITCHVISNYFVVQAPYSNFG